MIIRQPKNYYRYGIEVMSLLTGGMFFIIIFLFFDDSYVIGRDDTYKSLFLFSFTLITLTTLSYFWYKIYKQFKKNREKLGYSSKEVGIRVLVEVIFIIIAAILGFLYFT